MAQQTYLNAEAGPYRLVTQSDFDGLVSAALLRSRGIVGEVKFVHPRDVKDGLIDLGPGDISAGLPYVEAVAMAFDHRLSESLKTGNPDNHLVQSSAHSTSRVIWDFFGGEEAFPDFPQDLLAAADRVGAGSFTREEVLSPAGWTLLSFVIDPRTGLGRWGNFRVSNQQLLLDLMDYCLELSVEEILELPDIVERVKVYQEHEDAFRDQIERCSLLWHNVLLVDLTGEDEIFGGNRFVKFALYPQASVSVQITWGFERRHFVITVSKSIFNRSCSVNIGALMAQQGGGGNADAGTCQLPKDEAPRAVDQIVERLSTVPVADSGSRFRYKGFKGEL